MSYFDKIGRTRKCFSTRNQTKVNTVVNPHDEQKKNLSLIFEFDEEISEIIGNEKDETKLIFEKYKLSLTLNISAKTSSN